MAKLLAVLFCLVLPLAVMGMEATTLHFNENQTLTINASTNNWNRLVIKGDKITRHVSPNGAFIFDGQKNNHGVVLSQNKDGSLFFKPVYLTTDFSLFIATQNGHYFTLRVNPVTASGQTFVLMPNNVSEKTLKFEKNTPYLQLLQTFMAGLLRGKSTQHLQLMTLRHQTAVPFSKHTRLTLTQVATSGVLKGLVYQLTNTGKHSAHYVERAFWHHGVRAVALSQLVVKPHHSATLAIIVSE